MKTLSMIKYVFTIIGLAMLVGAYFLYANTQEFLNESITAEGKVIELVRKRSSDSTTYAPVVTFRSQSGLEVEFVSSSSSNPPGYSEGELVEVLYQKGMPHKAKINGFFVLWGGALIVACLGAVFFMVGFSMVLVGQLKSNEIEYLKRNGYPILAKFQRVDLNESLEVNGRNPYRILAQWKNPSTSKVHVFSSENIWFDPTDYIAGDEITVLIDSGNPKKYYVDTAFLPALAS